MSKTVRPYTPGQCLLLPPSPMDWLPEGHLARFILDLVKELDLDGIYARYERDLRGFPPYHPQMMVGLLLYAYCVGVPSSRKIERKTYEDVAFWVIAGEAHPDHSRINEFRRVHLEALAGLFAQVLRLCQQAGLVKLGKVALDGTKMKANASKHKAMSYPSTGSVGAAMSYRRNSSTARAAWRASAPPRRRWKKRPGSNKRKRSGRRTATTRRLDRRRRRCPSTRSRRRRRANRRRNHSATSPTRRAGS